MKITLVSRGYWPFVKGGSERFAKWLREELLKRGHEVTVVTAAKSGGEGVVPIKYPFWIPLLSSFLFSLKASKVVNSMQPDVALINAYWAEASPIFLKLPKVYVVHDVGFLEEGAKGIVNKLRKEILKRAIQNSEVIIVPLEYTKKLIVERLGADENKVEVLGGEGVDGPFEYVRKGPSSFNVVEVARFAPNKGQVELIEAFRRSLAPLGAKLWLVGSVSDERYFKRVKRLAEEVNKEYPNSIIIKENVPDVGEYYALADVCAFPSLANEGFGLALFECMSYGKPVIVSSLFKKIGSVEDEAIVVEPRVEELSEALKYVFENYDEVLKEYGRKGLERAKELSWERVAERVERALMKAMELKAR